MSSRFVLNLPRPLLPSSAHSSATRAIPNLSRMSLAPFVPNARASDPWSCVHRSRQANPCKKTKTQRQSNCPYGNKNKRTSTSGSHPLAASITLHCTGSELVESANAVVPLKSLAMSNVPLAIASAHGKHHPSPLDGNTNASALLYMAVNKTRRQVNRIAHTNIIKIHSPAMSSRVASSPSRAVTTSTLAS